MSSFCSYRICYRRFRRFLTSFAPIAVVGVPAIVGIATPIIVELLTKNDRGSQSQTSFPTSLSLGIALGLLVGFVLLGFQTYFEYKRRTYDPTWALRFDDRFNSRDIRAARASAAQILKNNIGNLRRRDAELSGIDEILDFFEDLGFYEHGEQLTPEVVHHAFHYWIRGYYTAARDYIEACQEKDPSRWEYVGRLFEVVHEIETERAKGKEAKFLTVDELNDFLEDEIALSSKNRR